MRISGGLEFTGYGKSGFSIACGVHDQTKDKALPKTGSAYIVPETEEAETSL